MNAVRAAQLRLQAFAELTLKLAAQALAPRSRVVLSAAALKLGRGEFICSGVSQLAQPYTFALSSWRRRFLTRQV